MSKTYKVSINDGKGEEAKTVDVKQGSGANGTPTKLTGVRGYRYELQDDAKGSKLAPDQVRVKRVGKNLHVLFDGSKEADLIIEDYYAEGKEGDNGSPMLVGQAENSGMYEYVPQDPALSSTTTQLKDGAEAVAISLGGGPLPADFVLAGLPVAAAGGIGGWLAGGAAVAAGAAAGGGGGGAAGTVVPSGQTGNLKHDPENDTGTSDQDSLTKNQNPTYTGVAERGATVEVTVNGFTYKTVASATDGSYSVELTNDGKPLIDGVYTPTIKVTNAIGSSSVDGTPFTVDSSATNNQPSNQVDPNKDAVIKVEAVSEDTGGNAIDFITTDTTVIASGSVSGFSNTGVAAGERLRVQIVDIDGVVKAQEFVTPASDGKWTMTTATSALALGDYTIKAAILDVAGNVVKAGEHALRITDTPTGQTGFLKHDEPNDTGASQTDSITMNQNPKYTGFAEKGAAVEVEINGVKYTATANASDGGYEVDVLNNAAILPDGVYTPKIKVTLNGKSTTVDGTPFTVDHSTDNNQPDNQVDPNKSAVIEVKAVSEDTGGNASDFITTDTTVIASGSVSNFSSTGAAAGERFRVQIVDKDGAVKAQEFVTPASNGTWAMTTATSALALGDYTIKAEILDVAGNVVKTADHTLQVVAASLTAKADKGSVQEDTTLTATGNVIRGATNGDGTDVDTNEIFSALNVVNVKAGTGAFQSVGTSTTINGMFGNLEIKKDGEYTYTLRNADTNVQELTSTSNPGVDTFTYEVKNNAGQSSTTTLTISVSGKDDLATMVVDLNRMAPFSASGTASNGKTITITDPDAGQNQLDILTGGSTYTGQFSNFKVEGTNTSGQYKWFMNKLDVPESDAIRHDLYTVRSIDHSSSETVDIEIIATGTATDQKFYTSTVDGLKVAKAATNFNDALILTGDQLTFDFTAPTTSLDSIERIDISGNLATGLAANTIKLSLASLTQADADPVSGVHRLIIDGDPTDIVQLNNTLGTAASHVTPTLSGGYNSYLIDPTHELLVKSSINVTFI